MYRDLGFIRVWGGQAGLPADAARDLRGVPYAYLVYPHKPIVAYLPQTASCSTSTASSSRTRRGRTAPHGCLTPTTCSPSGWPSRATSGA